MENEPTNISQSAPKLKRTVAIIAGLLLIGAVAAGAVTLLKNIAPKAPGDAGSNTVTPAAEVIKALQAPNAIKSLEKFTLQANAADSARVIYRADNRPYTISAPSKGSVLFTAPTPGAQANNTPEDDIVNFIIQNGYEKTENTGIALQDSVKYTTFKSPIGVCQLRSFRPGDNQQTLAFYEIACTDSTTLAQEYSTLEMLFALYKEREAMPAFTTATRTSKTDDNKALSIVTLNGGSTSKILLFAAIDNNWEYLGDLSGNNPAGSNGKYSISNDMRNKIDDARWGNFLKKNLQ